MIEQMFAAVLPITLWGSLCIVGVLGVRKLFARRLAAGFFRLAWLVLAVRLALPFSFALPKAPVQLEMPQYGQAVTEHSSTAAQAQARLPENGYEESAKTSLLFAAVAQKLPYMWFAGTVLFLSIQLILYARFLRRLRTTRNAVREVEIHKAVQAAFGRQLPVYWVQAQNSPFLAGLFQPSLYLPIGTDSAALPYIFAHEAQHYKRKDIPYQFVLLLAQAMQWFNPLVYWMKYTAQKDLELACDAAVLQKSDIAYRKAYGGAVLRTLQQASGRAKCSVPLGTGFIGSKTAMKVRFTEMFCFGKKSKGGLMLTLLLALVAAASTLVACGTKAAEAPQSTVLPQNMPSQTVQGSEDVTVPRVVSMTQDEAVAALQAAGLTADIVEAAETQSDVQASGGNQIVVSAQTPAAGTRAVKGTVVKLDISSAVQDAWQQNDGYLWPVPEYTYVTAEFGANEHRGTDIAAQEGANIYACAGGTVTKAEKHDSYGNYVVIDHGNNTTSLYAHCKTLTVQAGDTVEQGQVIATVGHTGNTSGTCLHFEISVDSKLVDPFTLVAEPKAEDENYIYYRF